MTKFTIIAFLLALVSTSVFATSDNNAKWDTANTLFNNKAYDSARVYYEQLAQDHESAALYYNLGNTYYKLNKVGKAVLNYERALRIDPSNSKTQDNLYLTQTRIANRIQATERIFFIRWWQNITHASHATLWAILALIIFVSVLIIHILKKLNIISFNIPQQATVGALVIWLLFLTFSIFATDNKYYSQQAVVMENNSSFKQQPDATKNSSLIPEGTKVSIEQQKGSWLEVILPDGRKGWMPAEVLTKI
ncbi:MAG: tetratricopeptide repeat protein [Flavipsychrobacter sp.]